MIVNSLVLSQIITVPGAWKNQNLLGEKYMMYNKAGDDENWDTSYVVGHSPSVFGIGQTAIRNKISAGTDLAILKLISSEITNEATFSAINTYEVVDFDRVRAEHFQTVQKFQAEQKRIYGGY